MATGNSATTSTPEYKTFRKCYETIILCAKEQTGAFCNALFAKGYISRSVRDQTRLKSITDEEKAQKLADTLIDRIEQDPSVYHGFIKIIEEAGPWAADFVKALKDSYEAEVKCERLRLADALGNSSSNNESFPYLDVSSVDADQIDELEAKLTSDTTDIKIRFSDFSVAIRDSLEARITLDKIKDSILSLDAFSDGIGVKMLDPQDTKEIKSAASLPEVFMILRSYVSFFNYGIIERLVHQYGSNEDKEKLEEYDKALNTFCKRNVYEIPPSAYSEINSRPQAKKFVLKCTHDTLTLQNVRAIKDKVTKVFGLKHSSLQLCTIEKGCVELHFLISAAVADHIFPVSPSQHSALSEIGVKIVIEEKHEPEPKFLEKDIKAMATDPQTPKWDSGSGKYCYGAIGKREILLISPDWSGQIPPGVVPRRPRKELSEDEQKKLEHQGVPRDCHHDDISIAKARFSLDETTTVSEVMTGDSLTCEQVKKQITKLMNNTDSVGVTLYYIGPGKKGTGDWCFSDGFISFREIMDLYMSNNHFKGKFLIINCDCSYSGSWVKEAMTFLDEQGVGPCGHMAKEKEILVKVYGSCEANEIPAELAFSAHCIKNDKNTGIISYSVGLFCFEIYNSQHPSGVDFTQGRCKNKIDQPCTMAPGSTWQKWYTQQRVISVCLNSARGRVWRYLLLVDDEETIRMFQDNISSRGKNKIDLNNYGQILLSGQGQQPPDEAKKQIQDHYHINYDYRQPSSSSAD